jgi:hypothetical protein
MNCVQMNDSAYKMSLLLPCGLLWSNNLNFKQLKIMSVSVSCLYVIPQNSHHKGSPKIISGMLVSSANFCTTNSKQTSLESPCSEKSASNFLSYGMTLSLLLIHGNINIQLLIHGLKFSWWHTVYGGIFCCDQLWYWHGWVPAKISLYTAAT